MIYQTLFDHMQNEHGLTLLNSEIEEIQRLVLEENKPKWVKIESGAKWPTEEGELNSTTVTSLSWWIGLGLAPPNYHARRLLIYFNNRSSQDVCRSTFIAYPGAIRVGHWLRIGQTTHSGLRAKT